jgi:hypothetical protein
MLRERGKAKKLLVDPLLVELGSRRELVQQVVADVMSEKQDKACCLSGGMD